MGLLLQTPRARLRRSLLALADPYRPADDSPLCGRVVMVTGASSGIGGATARAAAASGATVLLVARRAEAVAEVQERIVTAGGRAVSYPCDLTDHDALDDLVNDAGHSIRRSPRSSSLSSRTEPLSPTLVRSARRVRRARRDLVPRSRGSLNLHAPSDVYAGRRALTPDQAAARVVRVLEDRPVVWGHPMGTVGEVLGLVAPRLADAVLHQVDKRVPDSAAARGDRPVGAAR